MPNGHKMCVSELDSRLRQRTVKTIQERMGHEDAAMTLNVYGHLIRLKKAEEISEPAGILSSVLAA
jgi:integrase